MPPSLKKSLVAVRINETFLCLTCDGQKLNFLFGNQDKDKYKLSETKQQR